MTPTTTSGAADLPEALRSIQRFEVVDCIDDKHVPAVIPNSTGPWVRYEDHAAELLRLHAYCQELESQVILDCMTHVQNPAEIEHFADDVSKNGAGLDMSTPHARITELESQLAQRFDAADVATASAQGFRDGVASLTVQAADSQPAQVMGDTPPPCDQELFDQGVSVGLFDIPKWTAEALCRGIAAATEARVDWHYIGGRVHIKALPAARATADSVQEDAALWHWLAEYLVGTRTDLDDEIVASETVNDLRKLVKAAIKQGEKQ